MTHSIICTPSQEHAALWDWHADEFVCLALNDLLDPGDVGHQVSGQWPTFSVIDCHPKRANTRPAEKRKKKRAKKKVTPEKWLRDRTSDLDYGVKLKKGEKKPVYENGTAKVTERLEGKRHYLDELNNFKYQQHWLGNETYYFMGTTRGKSGETLVKIDIDCHHKGTLAGAIKFAKFLQRKFFHTLYWEISTNGNGVHAYFLLQTPDEKATGFYRMQLKLLQSWLRTKTDGFDIELVEIKGLMPDVLWGKQKGKVDKLTLGVLAKLPREVDRFDEWQKTTKLTAKDIGKLVGPSVRKAAKKAKRKQAARASAKANSNATSNLPKSVVRSPAPGGGGRLTPDTDSNKLVTGSCTSLPPAPELIDFDVADSLIEMYGSPKSCAGKVTNEDIAIFLAITKLGPNEDGTMPSARIEAIWKSWAEADVVFRSYQPSRVAAIRNWLADHGELDDVDERYWFFPRHQERGRAMKWRLSDNILRMLGEIDGHVMNEVRVEKECGGGETSFSLNPPSLKPVKMGWRPKAVIKTAPWLDEDDELTRHEYRVNQIVGFWMSQAA